ncbi:MAG: ATP-binding cassette domain-containing protein [Spirochaetales bacterium]|jgi:oligopeptide transport system ATP-binding protein|nr:ATP-binding cassette domain-containing protein [Spirochaetales bacterium]
MTSLDKDSSNTLLEVKNLKVHFPIYGGIIKKQVGTVYAVDGINFEIKAGETLGLVGESGCGKSTTARAVARLYDSTEGQIIFNGQDITHVRGQVLLEARKNMQMVFQDPYASLDPRMTAGQIIAEPLNIFRRRGLITLSRQEIKERVEELMEKVGLSRQYRNRYPHEFSGGQRQRIGVARALSLYPRLILTDEPVSALDVSIQSQILNLLTDLQEEFNLSYLFIAHDLAVVEHISERIAVMYLGRIVESSHVTELYKSPLHPYTEALLSAVPIPDPKVEKTRRRIILTGDVPSPDVLRPGCVFAGRCPRVLPKCRESLPVYKMMDSHHGVACFLYD